MHIINFTPALKRFYPKLKTINLEAETLNQIFPEIEKIHPGLTSYLLDDQGNLRQHVNIFINGKMLADRSNLEINLENKTEIFLMQALSGG